MKALILCGGEDKNLTPISYTIPKELIPIGNKPLLVYTIELLLKSGINELAIVVNAFNKPIFEKVLKYYLKKDFQYLIEKESKGIVHALLLAEEFIKGDKFIMLLGDNFFDFDLKSFISNFEEEEMTCKILLKEVEEPEKFSVAYIGNGRIIDLEERPKMAFSNWAITGLYAFNKNIFEASKAIEDSNKGQYQIVNVVKWLMGNGHKVGYEKLKGSWRDIDSPSELIEQNIDILSSLERNIAGEVIDSKVSGKIILMEGSTIYNSIIRGPIVIGQNTTIKNSYIGPYTSIGNGVTIDKSNIENSIILDRCNIWGIEDPIDSSVIGEGSTIMGTRSVKKSHKIIVGRNSKVYLGV